ncbi:alpha-ketoglutarate decarboxylase [uncultured Zobellia sp.]|uniref:alpha-ketoglutarate decarboxylase n=1 Tax=uncultured Zobellia sp. TaxID=255433 RepID=UPI00259540A1|nr:alpha-ketoglutarate decarboxylase [uncultured Zobellia sp.]
MIKKLYKIPKSTFLGLFLIVFALNCSAQNTSAPSDFWNNVKFGGGLGFGLTNGGFNASVSPSAIYQFNDQFSSGVSLTFNYAKLNNDKRYAYGGSILSLYNPLPFLQISAELEQLRINRSIAINGFPDIEDNYWSPALFLGLGYTDRNFTLGISYNLLYDDNKSIYANAWLPFVRVYF